MGGGTRWYQKVMVVKSRFVGRGRGGHCKYFALRSPAPGHLRPSSWARPSFGPGCGTLPKQIGISAPHFDKLCAGPVLRLLWGFWGRVSQLLTETNYELDYIIELQVQKKISEGHRQYGGLGELFA